MNYSGYVITASFDNGVERDGKIVEGFYCEVYRADDDNYADMLDSFCLGVGYEIPNLEEDTLDKALKQYIDENARYFDEFCFSKEIDRYKTICGKAFDYIGKTTAFEELYNLLRNEFGLSDEEIESFGYDFSDLKQEKNNRVSLFHFHDTEDDFYFITHHPYTLYEISCIYQEFLKDKIGVYTLDSIASDLSEIRKIDDVVFDVLCDSLPENNKISSAIRLDFDENIIGFYEKTAGSWSEYTLETVSHFAKFSHAQEHYSKSAQAELFAKLIAEEKINIDVGKSTEETPTLDM